MSRTKKTARKSTAGRAPRKQLATKAQRKRHYTKKEVNQANSCKEARIEETSPDEPKIVSENGLKSGSQETGEESDLKADQESHQQICQEEIDENCKEETSWSSLVYFVLKPALFRATEIFQC